MASIGEELTFRVSLYDKTGVLGDPTTVVGAVLLPNGKIPALTFAKKSVGVYESTYVTEVKGDHWLRIETTGPIKTAVEKKFEVTEQKVVINA